MRRIDLLTHASLTVEPKDVLSMAEFLTRWPENTAWHIIEQLHTHKTSNSIRTMLTLYELEDAYYQHNPVEPYNYQGFLLKLTAVLAPENRSYEEYIKKFSNMFVLKDDVLEIEKTNRHYCALTPGNNSKPTAKICRKDNLHVTGPEIFRGIFKYPQEIQSLPKTHLYPWLGPVNPELPSVKVTRTVEDDKEEIEYFVKAAKELGQNNPYCLAKMVKYRYPDTSHPLLVDVIEPGHSRNSDAARQQGRRWLTEDAESHADATC